jgi:flagellar basal-body rod modification protein FlgD
MTVSNIQAALSGTPPASQTVGGSTSSTPGLLGKDDFLKLLVTQLQKQDPLNPQDPSEFTSQLAQYSSLEQLIGVNSNIQGLSASQVANNQASAVNYIGKTVRVSGNQVTVGGGVASAMSLNLTQASAKTGATITDANGAVVATVDLGAQSAGAHGFTWNGKNSAGQQVADGTYNVTFAAQDSSGQAIAVDSSTSGTVTGVSFANGQTKLIVGGASWSLSQVLSVGS